MPAPSRREDGEELIFMSNDQTFIESDHIARHVSSSKQRPDVIATFTSTLKNCYTESPKTTRNFGDWTHLVSDDSFRKSLSGKGGWIDVLQTWEMDAMHRNVNPDVESEESTKTQDSTRPPPENRKRRADEAISGDKKRARVIPNVTSGEPKPFRALDEEQNLIPDLRCAYYAIERLRAAYHVTHTMAVLLEGKYNFFALRIP